MEVSIQEVINAIRINRIATLKGHLQSTGNINQSIYFEESKNIRFILDVEDGELIIYYIPQTIIIPCENDIKKFEIKSLEIESISEGILKETINSIVSLKEYQKELIILAAKLAINRKGKLILIK
ncbi:TPA: hypothetical protein MM130_000368 [Klebsiella quasipneumoniae subsp. similipneumoniae]|uniref:hypothetical protein n=1 Tax=Klebsiella oxytoca TaxID=571 RepID=UPI00224867EF|nr:hypothetical protein [Klebsiella oxytoca]MCW9608709.1 hypothetical protein [Klebsiella oxytoca]MCW9676592.1 hypothetical protein [Klebsiella oxytoca]HBZ7523814.1 hypothetical protein [Klebsiella quasipneumoniae subsp. similipneumoniae]HBZ8083603.1 hypothetical protein [Klebsiella quasipneumoniae subsp. similipneumoniae]